MTNSNELNFLSKDFTMVRELGGGRRVHARGCPILANYEISPYSIEEVTRFKMGKNKSCQKCKTLMYIANAAVDYLEHYPLYKRWFEHVGTNTLAQLVFDKKAKFEIIGQRLYIKSGPERFYIDFSLFDTGELRLFHNNYNIKAREEDKANKAGWDKCGYHEHQLEKKNDMIDPLTNVLNYIVYYDYDKGAKTHTQKKRKMLISDLDPEFWGL